MHYIARNSYVQVMVDNPLLNYQNSVEYWTLKFLSIHSYIFCSDNKSNNVITQE